MSSYQWPPTGGGSAYWGDGVSTSSALPGAGVVVGQVVQALDTGTFYRWTGSSWIVDPSLTQNISGILPIGNGGTASGAALNNKRFIVSSAGAIVEAAAVTANVAVITDVNGLPASSTTTATELGYVHGVTSAIQTQLSGKQATGNYITGLTGDVTAAGPGSVAATVASVGGSTATNVHAAELAANAATNLNTASAIVKRDVSGNFSAGTITAALSGNATTATTAGNVTGTVAIANGGTGQTAAAAGFDALSPNTTLGDVSYRGVSGNVRLAGNTTATRNFLRQTGTGTVSAAPAWDTLVAGDIPSIDTSKLTTGTLPVARGGTNSATTLNNNRFVISSAGAIVEASAVTASAAVVTDASGLPTASSTTAAELGFVHGVTSAVQTQLDAKLCCTSVSSIAVNTTLANKTVYFVDTTAARTLTLPAPAASLYIVVKDVSGSAQTNNITINPAVAQTIDGASSYSVDANYASVIIVSDGNNYYVV